ncbi:MAG TPA: TonB-dependent receptor [Kofleriaceae bacterium]
MRAVRHRHLRTAASLVVLAAPRAAAHAEDVVDKIDIEQYSLDDLLKTETSVASVHAVAVRETPGIVTIIKREEIMSSGARDLIDVLMLVPGFSFGVDIEGVTDVGFRGIWAHEGKMLILVDGQEMNELLFQNNELGHHYPIDQIERIEIIRGPGSALYGGFAELGVISITTRGAAELNGISTSVDYGRMRHALGQADLNVAAGKESIAGIEGLNASAALLLGVGNRSDATFTDFSGNSYGLGDSSALPALFLDIGVQYKDLRTRFLYDGYAIHERDSISHVQPAAVTENFTTMIADAQYDLHLGPVTVTPRLTFKRQLPWRVADSSSSDYLDITVQRLTASVTATMNVTDDLNVTAGVQAYQDRGWLNSTEHVGQGNQFLFANGQDKVSYNNVATPVEAQYHSALGTLTLGARYERHSEYRDSFVPRAALTKVIDRFHFKLLYQYAFRPPGIGDLAQALPSPKLTPEHLRDAEAEVGYRLSDGLFVAANVFDITLRDPIIYYSTSSSSNNYQNFPYTGTQGVEFDLRAGYHWGRFEATYSYYTARNVLTGATKNVVPLYQVSPTSSQLLAMPAHKATFRGSFPLGSRLSFDPTATFMSSCYGYLTGDDNGNGVLGKTGPVFLFNPFVNYRDLIIPRLDLSVGVFDLFGANYQFVQPYASTHAPLPGPTRDFVARLSYSVPL